MQNQQQQPYPMQQPQAQAAQPKRYDGENGQPKYDVGTGGHYGASAAIAAGGHAPPAETFTGHWGNVSAPNPPPARYCANSSLCQVSQGLAAPYRDILNTYWQNQVSKLETDEHDYKIHQLPLARIKKVMKADPEVKMISAEAPILFAKGCDIFITELTMRAWIHAEENKRRTLQRSDIASALAKSDMFDFLIDIVPREDATPQHKRRPEFQAVSNYQVPDSANNATAGASGMGPDQAQMGGQPEFAGMDQQHMPPQHYQTQMGAYPPPAQQTQYTNMSGFDPSMYGQPGAYPINQMPQMQPPVSVKKRSIPSIEGLANLVEQMYQQPPQHRQPQQGGEVEGDYEYNNG
jgi:nuclear transcription factor Y, gamma